MASLRILPRPQSLILTTPPSPATSHEPPNDPAFHSPPHSSRNLSATPLSLQNQYAFPISPPSKPKTRTETHSSPIVMIPPPDHQINHILTTNKSTPPFCPT